MVNLRELTRNFRDRIQSEVRRLFPRQGAAPVTNKPSAVPSSGRSGLMDRVLSLAKGQGRAVGDPAGAGTEDLYGEVVARLTDRFGPRSTALVPVLLARAEFEAGRGRKSQARNAAAAARSIMLAQWGRNHPLWPLVEARYDAICTPKPGQPGRR